MKLFKAFYKYLAESFSNYPFKWLMLFSGIYLQEIVKMLTLFQQLLGRLVFMQIVALFTTLEWARHF